MQLARYVFLFARLSGIILTLLPGEVGLTEMARAQTPAVPIIDTVAGASGGVGDDGRASAAVLVQPGGLATDPSGNIYVAETGAHRIRKIDRAGFITTVAGTGISGFAGDGGPALNAKLNLPYGLACDRAGNLFIADLGNARVRRLGIDGTITTVAGGGSLAPGGADEGLAATKIALAAPRNLAVDDNGVVYISDFNGHRVFRMAADGTLATFAGTGTPGNGGDGGAAKQAQLANPAGLAIDSQNALYIADSQNHEIRKVAAGGVISTTLQAATPTGVAVGFLGDLWVADPGAQSLTQYLVSGSSQAFPFSSSAVIRGADLNLYALNDDTQTVTQITLAGASTVFAGGGSAGQGSSLNHPTGVASDAAGNIFVADRDNNRVQRVDPSGGITTIGIGAAFSQPSGVSVDAVGNVYVADTGNHRVVSISAWGSMQTLGTNAAFSSPVNAVPDGSGNIYVADLAAGKIQKIAASGALSTVLTNLSGPQGLAIVAGFLYFTEEAGPHVSRLNLSTGVVTKLAEGAWMTPRGIAVNTGGSVLVADSGRQQILQVDAAGNIAIVAGTSTAGFSGDGGAAATAQLNFPYGLSFTAGGDLLIADFANNRIRRVKGLTDSLTAPGSITSGSSPSGNMQVLNGASLTAGAVAPGMLLSLTGTGILAADMASTSVLINSIPAPIISMSDTEIRVVAPLTLAAVNQVSIDLIFKGAIAATATVKAAAAAPALFTPANTAANPAARGSNLILFGTGLGLGDLPVAVSIGGAAARVVALDPSPGYPGLFQLTAQVPTTTAVGVQSVIVAVGGASSQTGVQAGVQ